MLYDGCCSSALHVLIHLIFVSNVVGAVFPFYRWENRNREVKWLIWGHTVSGGAGFGSRQSGSTFYISDSYSIVPLKSKFCFIASLKKDYWKLTSFSFIHVSLLFLTYF